VHQAARRGLVERVGRDQALRDLAAFGETAVALERVDLRLLLLAPALLQRGALCREPRVELVAFGEAQAGEELAGAVVEIVADARRQRQQLGALGQDVGAEAATEAEQPLAQDVARAFGRLLRPEQTEQSLTRRRPFEGDEGEERRVDRCQRLDGAIGAADRGAAGQHQVQCIQDCHLMRSPPARQPFRHGVSTQGTRQPRWSTPATTQPPVM
jgi:hypothetical protein